MSLGEQDFELLAEAGLPGSEAKAICYAQSGDYFSAAFHLIFLEAKGDAPLGSFLRPCWTCVEWLVSTEKKKAVHQLYTRINIYCGDKTRRNSAVPATAYAVSRLLLGPYINLDLHDCIDAAKDALKNVQSASPRAREYYERIRVFERASSDPSGRLLPPSYFEQLGKNIPHWYPVLALVHPQVREQEQGVHRLPRVKHKPEQVAASSFASSEEKRLCLSQNMIEYRQTRSISFRDIVFPVERKLGVDSRSYAELFSETDAKPQGGFIAGDPQLSLTYRLSEAEQGSAKYEEVQNASKLCYAYTVWNNALWSMCCTLEKTKKKLEQLQKRIRIDKPSIFEICVRDVRSLTTREKLRKIADLIPAGALRFLVLQTPDEDQQGGGTKVEEEFPFIDVNWADLRKSSGEKDPIALFFLGLCYLKGICTEGGQITTAIDLFVEAAALGNLQAGLIAAYCHMVVIPDTAWFSDKDTAEQYLSYVAGQGEKEAALVVARKLAEDGDIGTAAEWWEQLSTSNCAEALYRLGCFLELEFHHDNKAMTEALSYYEKAAHLGHSAAAFCAGCLHYRGIGSGLRDVVAAEKYWKLSADMGDPRACYNVAVTTLAHSAVDEIRDDTMSLFRTAAECGMPEAQYYLGIGLLPERIKHLLTLTYPHGLAHEPDLLEGNAQEISVVKQALFWLFWASDSIPQSCYAASVIFIRLLGKEGLLKERTKEHQCPRTLRRLFKRLAFVARKGNADCQNALGWCYWQGHIMRKSKKKALSWWRKGAKSGCVACHVTLGRVFLEYVVNKGGNDRLKHVKEVEKAINHFLQGAAFREREIAPYLSLALLIRADAMDDPESWQKAVTWLRLAVAAGDRSAALALGNILLARKIKPLSDSDSLQLALEAENCLQMAEALNDSDQQLLFDMGKMFARWDDERAMQYLRRVHDTGDKRASYLLSRTLSKLNGDSHAIAESRSLLRESLQLHGRQKELHPIPHEEKEWLLRCIRSAIKSTTNNSTGSRQLARQIHIEAIDDSCFLDEFDFEFWAMSEPALRSSGKPGNTKNPQKYRLTKPKNASSSKKVTFAIQEQKESGGKNKVDRARSRDC